MIHNIQRFTTQRIPTAVVEGLEPKRLEPQSRTLPFGQKPFGKPGVGAKPGFGKKAFGKKKPLGVDRDRSPFGGPARKPFGPRPSGPR